jgi:hypothetical protein
MDENSAMAVRLRVVALATRQTAPGRDDQQVTENCPPDGGTRITEHDTTFEAKIK